MISLFRAARRAEERVIFVEGEKDADRMSSLGLVATTTYGRGVWAMRGHRIDVVDGDRPAGAG